MARLPSPADSAFAKIIDLPSGPQVGSPSISSILDCPIWLGLPPSAAESKTAFHGSLDRTSVNTIFEPSGDHRGPYALTGGDVSFTLALRSGRLFHSVMSG